MTTTTVLAVPGEMPFPGTLTKTSLALETDDYDKWSRIVLKLEEVGKAHMWWIGDALNYGERCFGEIWAQVVDDTGYSVNTVKAAMYVSSRVSPERRREELSFGHHQVVASLDPDAQTRWLTLAVNRGWSIADLRAAMRPPKDVPEHPLLIPGPACVACGADGPESCHYTGMGKETVSIQGEIQDIASADLCQACHDRMLAADEDQEAAVQFLLACLKTNMRRLERRQLKC